MVNSMNKKTLIVVTSLLAVFLFSSVSVFSQGGDEAFRVRLESILTNFKNYRFSEVSIYKIKDIKDIRNAIKAKEEQEGTGAGEVQGETDDCVKNADKAIANFVENATREGQSISQVRRDMLGRGMTIPADLDCIFMYYDKKQMGVQKPLKNAYAVTTRMMPGQIEPNIIIGLIVTTEDEEFIEKNISSSAPGNVYTYPELKNFELNQSTFRANTMYDLVLNAFRQSNYENKTLEAQGIGTGLMFATKKYGVSNSLVNKKFDITSQDIQKFLQVSDGQPNEMRLVTNEVVLSPDLIRYAKYSLITETYEDGTTDTLNFITNTNLPKFGAELRYGIEEIGYPSLWSERMTLSALWQGTKLGLILPTDGWSSLAKDAFSIDRKLTFGGVGVSSSIDFPVLLMPATGVFQLKVGYIFGDAEPATYKNRNTDPEEYVYTSGDDDYLIRANASLLYTFGLAIDEDYILRFGLGGTIYSAERWNYQIVENEFREKDIKYLNADSEVVGGITGKLDFMAKSMSTPFGASLQYFDEGIFTNIWLQIPVVQNRAYVRLDAKGFFKAFAESPRAWENESIFIPMARIILNF
jgi:hypothetical protein